MLDLLNAYVIISVFVASIYILRTVVPLQTNRRTYAPGPWGFPVVGHLPLFGRNPPETFMKWREKYGDIFCIRMGSWKTVVLNGYSVIKEAMGRKDDTFSDRPRFYSVELFKKAINGEDTFGLHPFNQSYIKMHKLIASALHRYTHTDITQTQELIMEEAAILIDEFLAWKGKPQCTGKVIRISVSSSLYQILYGRGQNIREDKLFQRVVDYSNEFRELAGSRNPLDVMP